MTLTSFWGGVGTTRQKKSLFLGVVNAHGNNNNNNKIVFGGIAFLATLATGVSLGGPLKNGTVECQNSMMMSSDFEDDDDDDFTTTTTTTKRSTRNNNNNTNEKKNKRYRIAHRTFRSEFSFVNNCLRLARNIANPTSIAALEFQKQLEQFDARFATWKEEYFLFSEEEEDINESEEEDREEEEEEDKEDVFFEEGVVVVYVVVFGWWWWWAFCEKKTHYRWFKREKVVRSSTTFN